MRPSFASLAIIIAALAATVSAADWKPPDKPKDDQHWYPEIPDNKELHETIPNGSFADAAPAEKGRLPHPKGWAHPDDLTSFWKDSGGHGKVIILDTSVSETEAKKRQADVREAAKNGTDVPPAPVKSKLSDPDGYDAIGATYGVSFYSEKFKCKPKQAYKISFDYKGASGGAKIWVRGWGDFNGEERRRYEKIVNCYTKGSEWTHIEEAFNPTRRGPDASTEISFLRVMLYAYWPPRQYSFGNIKIEEISAEEYNKMK